VSSQLIQLEVVDLPSDIEDVYRILGVAGVGHSLRAHALVGVGPGAGDVEGLIGVPALGLLVGGLEYLVSEITETVEQVFLVVAEEVPVEVLAELLEVADKVSV
jgi:hypothetical protein